MSKQEVQLKEAIVKSLPASILLKPFIVRGVAFSYLPAIFPMITAYMMPTARVNRNAKGAECPCQDAAHIYSSKRNLHDVVVRHRTLEVDKTWDVQNTGRRPVCRVCQGNQNINEQMVVRKC